MLRNKTKKTWVLKKNQPNADKFSKHGLIP
jgi:hypothetical protein